LVRSVIKGNAQQMKEYNRALILRLIRQEGTVSRTHLAKLTGLSPTTVSVIADALISEGLVQERASEPLASAGAGRRPILLEIRPEAGFFIAVDLGVTNTTVVLYDLASNVRARRTAPTPKGQGAHASIEQILRFISNCLGAAGVLQDQVAGVGFGVPGLVDSERGISRLSHNLGFRDVPFKEILESRLGVPVFVENVIRMTTLAEKWLGAGKGVSDLICIGIGSGLGAGIVTGEKLYRGPGHGAGEIGHTVVMPGGPLCRCGNRGCLEALVTGPGIVGRALDRLEAGEPSSLRELSPDNVAALSAETIAEHAIRGDRLCCEVFWETGVYLGHGVANMINLFGIPFVIIGGGIAQAGELLFQPVIETVRGHVYSVDADQVKIVPRHLGSEASLLGAALLVSMETVFRLPGAGSFLETEGVAAWQRA